MKNNGSLFEEFIHYVYSSLIRLESPNILVGKNIVINGKNGSSYEFDVYYEFTKANIRHRVAIECKDHGRPVERKYVHDFMYKIEAVAPIVGVMISRSGYQEGAIIAARDKGILLLTEKDLPTLNEILAKKLEYAFLPNEDTIGEPFWTIMETRKGQLTGTYYCLPGSSEEEYKIALFISKRVADTYVRLTRKSDLVVRGVNQAQLKGLIELSKNHKLTFHLAMFEPLNCKEWTFMELSTEIVNQDYCLS